MKRISIGVGAAALTAVLACSLAAAADSRPAPPPYAYATNGIKDDIAGPLGSRWKLLLDESNTGGKELEMLELTMQPGTVVPSHTHAALEVIYVLSGIYEHEVNGKRYRLQPGMVGLVRPGDHVRHLVPAGEAAKVLVIWVPAGEAGDRYRHATGTTPAPVPEVP